MNNNDLPQLDTSHWQHLHGAPVGAGLLKQQTEDFVVTEDLGFEPSGSGEHIFLWLEKSNLNTAFVAEEIGKFCRLPLRNITYAGRKDKFALTRQWIGVHIANHQEPKWDEFSLAGAQILKITRNDRKLRTGVLAGNRFDIVVRNVVVDSPEALDDRLQLIKLQGVPNYYGPQRFGERKVEPIDAQKSAPAQLGGNLALAEKLIQGEQIRNRNKRSMAISALRSWLFNECIHQRINNDHFFSPMLGDAMGLSGSNSFFVNSASQSNIAQRLEQRDINITAPLWGSGKLHTQDQALAFETALGNDFPAITSTLEGLGLKQERRSISLYPEHFTWRQQDDQLRLSFSLPAGCFATSIIREVLDV